MFLITIKLGLWLVGEDQIQFSSHYMKGKNYLHNVDFEHLVAVVLVRFPHKTLLSPFHPVLCKELPILGSHLRRGELCSHFFRVHSKFTWKFSAWVIWLFSSIYWFNNFFFYKNPRWEKRRLLCKLHAFIINSVQRKFLIMLISIFSVNEAI